MIKTALETHLVHLLLAITLSEDHNSGKFKTLQRIICYRRESINQQAQILKIKTDRQREPLSEKNHLTQPRLTNNLAPNL
ncbi:hypothetical protein FGO68_gene13834 [Halteria grandinella]|uniref:Uncharacterized protein n=1 Tax=Halteria grandinella TaxID=5974 RepID=A0A8J8T9G7_HALGN|nr:hypothetical protein FGO68_gene13834 [Halteria grandinella]